jgi:hypothetical protein
MPKLIIFFVGCTVVMWLLSTVLCLIAIYKSWRLKDFSSKNADIYHFGKSIGDKNDIALKDYKSAKKSRNYFLFFFGTTLFFTLATTLLAVVIYLKKI